MAPGLIVKHRPASRRSALNDQCSVWVWCYAMPCSITAGCVAQYSKVRTPGRHPRLKARTWYLRLGTRTLFLKAQHSVLGKGWSAALLKLYKQVLTAQQDSGDPQLRAGSQNSATQLSTQGSVPALSKTLVLRVMPCPPPSYALRTPRHGEPGAFNMAGKIWHSKFYTQNSVLKTWHSKLNAQAWAVCAGRTPGPSTGRPAPAAVDRPTRLSQPTNQTGTQDSALTAEQRPGPVHGVALRPVPAGAGCPAPSPCPPDPPSSPSAPPPPQRDGQQRPAAHPGT